MLRKLFDFLQLLTAVAIIVGLLYLAHETRY